MTDAEIQALRDEMERRAALERLRDEKRKAWAASAEGQAQLDAAVRGLGERLVSLAQDADREADHDKRPANKPWWMRQ